MLEFIFSLRFFVGLVIGAIGGFITEFFVARNNKKMFEQAQKALAEAQQKYQQVQEVLKK